MSMVIARDADRAWACKPCFIIMTEGVQSMTTWRKSDVKREEGVILNNPFLHVSPSPGASHHHRKKVKQESSTPTFLIRTVG